MAEAELPVVAAPQPYGLTNFQIKYAGSLLSDAWTPLVGWSHHDARRILGMDPFTWQDGTNTPRYVRHEDVVNMILRQAENSDPPCSVDELMQKHYTASAWCTESFNWRLTGDREDLFNDLIGGDLDDEALMESVMLSATESEGTKLAFDFSRAKGQPARIRGLIRKLIMPPVLWVPITAACGHAIERFASVAICGSEILFRAINDTLLRLLQDDASLLEGLLDVGYDAPVKVADYRSGVEAFYVTGVRMSAVDEAVKVALLQRFLRRRVLLVTDGTPKAAKAILFSSRGELAQDQLPCLILAHHWVGFAPLMADDEDEETVCFQGTIYPSQTVLAVSRGRPASSYDAQGTNLRGVSRGEGCHFPSVTMLRDYVANTGIALLFQSLPACYFALDVPRQRGYHINVPYEVISMSRASLLASAPFGRCDMALNYLGSALPVGVEVLQADADGHCLFHAISRCLTGKQYLWHPMRTALYLFMKKNRSDFEAIFQKHEFLAGLVEELDTIIERVWLPIAEASATTDEPSTTVEPTADKAASETPAVKRAQNSTVMDAGLGTEHVFALSNLLRRPILLFDGPTSPNPEGFLFLPLLIPPEEMVTRKALCIGWYSHEHGHFVPVVPSAVDQAVKLTAADIPRGPSGAPLVFAVAAADVDAKLAEYLGGPTWQLEIGGEIPEALVPTLGQYIEHLFAAKHHVALVTIDTFAHTVAGLQTMTTENLFDPSPRFRANSITMLQLDEAHSMRFCTTCVKYAPAIVTTTGVAACSFCAKPFYVTSPCLNKDTGFSKCETGATTMIPASPGSSRSGFKKWIANTGPSAVNAIVMARDHGTAYAPARVRAIYSDALTAGDVAFDIEFVADKTKRFAVPAREVLPGYAVDNFKLETMAVLGMQYVLRVASDEIPELCTNEQTAYDEFVAKHSVALSRIRLRNPDVDRNIKNDFKDFIEIFVEDFKYEAMFSSTKNLMSALKRQATTELASQNLEAGNGQLRGVWQDDDGNEVAWESCDPISREWIPYDREASGKLEATFRAGGKLCVITITGYGDFTVVFKSMIQKNAIGGGRDVRQVKKTPFECDVCTYHNVGKRERCEMCDTPRKGGFLVTRDRYTAEEERASEKYTHPSFAEGGDHWNLAAGAGYKLFGGVYYVRVDALKRYLPVEFPIHGRSPLYKVIKDAMAESGSSIVTISGLRFVKNTEPSMGDSYICSVSGRDLKQLHFFEFVRADLGLRGPSGDQFLLCEAQSSHKEEINLSVYGGVIRFALSTRSAVGPIYVPILLNVPRTYPLWDDLNAVPRTADNKLQYHGWNWEYNPIAGTFHAKTQIKAKIRPAQNRLDNYDFDDDYPTDDRSRFGFLLFR